MIYDTSNPFDKEKLLVSVAKAVEARAVVEFTRKKQGRSLAQNAYLHVILGYYASQTGMTLDEVKVDVFKRTCNRELFEREIVNRRGKTVKVLRSSADLDTGEMTLAIDRFRNYSASVAEIYLPSPEEDSFITYCLQEMERYKEFI